MLKGYVLAQAQFKLNLLYICLQAFYLFREVAEVYHVSNVAIYYWIFGVYAFTILAMFIVYMILLNLLVTSIFRWKNIAHYDHIEFDFKFLPHSKHQKRSWNRHND